PTAERTVGPARIVMESLTPKPGIREHYRPQAVIERIEIPQRAVPTSCAGITLPSRQSGQHTGSSRRGLRVEPCHARHNGSYLVSSSSKRTPKPGGVHHVRCVEAKKLDQTGGDG